MGNSTDEATTGPKQPDPRRKADGTWAKGVSGNPGGRPLSFVKKIERELDKEFGKDTQADELARIVIQRAVAGEEFYVKLAIDRLWPVVKQLEVNDTTERHPLEVEDTEEARRRLARMAESLEPPAVAPTHPAPDKTQ